MDKGDRKGVYSYERRLEMKRVFERVKTEIEILDQKGEKGF